MIQQQLEIASKPILERKIRTEIAYKKFLISAVNLKLMTYESGATHARVANERIKKYIEAM
jgi:hypothetical protein